MRYKYKTLSYPYIRINRLSDGSWEWFAVRDGRRIGSDRPCRTITEAWYSMRRAFFFTTDWGIDPEKIELHE